jgi:hypothetical protein
MACNPGEPHGDAIRGNSGPGRVPVGRLFGVFLRDGTGDAPGRRGNATLRGRNRFGTGSVLGGSDGVATRFSGLPVSGVGWCGDMPFRSREARRCRVTSFGRRARTVESGFLVVRPARRSRFDSDVVRGMGVVSRNRRCTGSPADRSSWTARRRPPGHRRNRPAAFPSIRRSTGWSAMAAPDGVGSPWRGVVRAEYRSRAWWTRRVFGPTPGNTASASSPVGSLCG